MTESNQPMMRHRLKSDEHDILCHCCGPIDRHGGDRAAEKRRAAQEIAAQRMDE